jgi:hypothetical protein
MSRGIAESDWRILRELKPIALDRFCRRVLDEVGRMALDPARTNHERYLAIYRFIADRDEELADAFNDMRRSRAILMICQLQRHGLLTDEEFARFGDETRAAVQDLLGISNP